MTSRQLDTDNLPTIKDSAHIQWVISLKYLCLKTRGYNVKSCADTRGEKYQRDSYCPSKLTKIGTKLAVTISSGDLGGKKHELCSGCRAHPSPVHLKSIIIVFDHTLFDSRWQAAIRFVPPAYVDRIRYQTAASLATLRWCR